MIVIFYLLINKDSILMGICQWEKNMKNAKASERFVPVSYTHLYYMHFLLEQLQGGADASVFNIGPYLVHGKAQLP